MKTIAPVIITAIENPRYVQSSWTPWCVSDSFMPSSSFGSGGWTPSVHILEAQLPALHEWNLLVLVEVNFFLDEATRT